MRIALVTPRFTPSFGGVEEYSARLAGVLAKKGHQVAVLTTVPRSYEGKMSEKGTFVVRRFRDLPFGFLLVPPGLTAFLCRHRESFDMTILNNYHSSVSLVGLLPDKFLVFRPHFHGTVVHSQLGARLRILAEAQRFLGGIVFSKSKVIVCGSDYEASLVRRRFPGVSGRVKVIPQVFPSDAAGNTLPRGPHKLLAVARLEPYKGIQYVIRALRFMPGYELTVIGEGQFREPLERMVKEYGLEPRVSFLGNVKRSILESAYDSASVFVLMSDHESVGMSVGEALSHGLPCVVFTSGALADWVDGENCFGVADRCDVGAIRSAIEKAEGARVSLRLPSWEEYYQTFEKEVLSRLPRAQAMVYHGLGAESSVI